MKRSACILLGLAAGFALLGADAAGQTDPPSLEIEPLVPVVFVLPGSSVQVEAVIQNASDDVLFFKSVSADAPDTFVGEDLFDDFSLTAPDSLLPGESWEGPVILLTLAPEADVDLLSRITVHFSGGVHPYDEQGLADFTFALNDSAAVVSVSDGAPAGPAILRVSPNPARGLSQIVFDMAVEQEAEVRVYDVTGAAIRSLVRGKLSAGRQTATWDGRGANGDKVAPGIYFIRLQTAGGVRRTKVIRIE